MGVTGIGGVFIRASDPDALGRWYADMLGVGGGEWGLWEQGAGTTVFQPFKADSDYFPSAQGVMLNFRVDDLDGLMAALRDKGVEVITNPEWDMPEVGRFARVHDPEGNAVELWQPSEAAPA
jgi:predicted enzyme related to lactoylglutathione lyase